MIERGLVDEVQTLLNHGYAGDIERLRSLGYREIAAFLRGEMPLEEAVEIMKRNTRRYAKRQLSWFRGDPRIQWLSAVDSSPAELAERIRSLIR
ncbi:MAG TPA: tRNA (adenosine(37)-N6)-dimethylallyltransferase MiaA, partial [Candidatus Hydrogenedentes bacterium]|nr:tRNA (adenosine(37)-N6)-dimethylallyltransferase MiaA [Candidatus Hydrogenedentota bacterium]